MTLWWLQSPTSECQRGKQMVVNYWRKKTQLQVLIVNFYSQMTNLIQGPTVMLCTRSGRQDCFLEKLRSFSMCSKMLEVASGAYLVLGWNQVTIVNCDLQLPCNQKCSYRDCTAHSTSERPLFHCNYLANAKKFSAITKHPQIVFLAARMLPSCIFTCFVVYL